MNGSAVQRGEQVGQQLLHSPEHAAATADAYAADLGEQFSAVEYDPVQRELLISRRLRQVCMAAVSTISAAEALIIVNELVARGDPLTVGSSFQPQQSRKAPPLTGAVGSLTSGLWDLCRAGDLVTAEKLSEASSPYYMLWKVYQQSQQRFVEAWAAKKPDSLPQADPRQALLIASEDGAINTVEFLLQCGIGLSRHLGRVASADHFRNVAYQSAEPISWLGDWKHPMTRRFFDNRASYAYARMEGQALSSMEDFFPDIPTLIDYTELAGSCYVLLRPDVILKPPRVKGYCPAGLILENESPEYIAATQTFITTIRDVFGSPANDLYPEVGPAEHPGRLHRPASMYLIALLAARETFFPTWPTLDSMA